MRAPHIHARVNATVWLRKNDNDTQRRIRGGRCAHACLSGKTEKKVVRESPTKDQRRDMCVRNVCLTKKQRRFESHQEDEQKRDMREWMRDRKDREGSRDTNKRNKREICAYVPFSQTGELACGGRAGLEAPLSCGCVRARERERLSLRVRVSREGTNSRPHQHVL